MGALFGKRSSSKLNNQSKITENDIVVLKLKQQRDKIKQYQKRINVQLERERDVVRKLIQDNKKDRALLILKKKKLMESLLEKSDNQLLNIEQMVQTIEFQTMQVDIVEKLKSGNEALKKLNDALDIDQIEDILAETKEGADKQREISNLFANQSGDEIEEDEDELMKELNKMIGAQDKSAEVVELPELPEVSKKPIRIDSEPEEIKETERPKKTKVMVEAS